MERVPFRNDRDHVDRVEQAPAEPVVAGRHIGNVHLALLELGCEPGAPVLHDVDLDAGVPPPKCGEEPREHHLDHGRRRADPDDARLSRLQGAGSLAQRVGLTQQPKAAAQQVLAGSGELHAAADAVEQLHAEVGLQHLDLP